MISLALCFLRLLQLEFENLNSIYLSIFHFLYFLFNLTYVLTSTISENISNSCCCCLVLLAEATGEPAIFAKAITDCLNIYDETSLRFKTGDIITVSYLFLYFQMHQSINYVSIFISFASRFSSYFVGFSCPLWNDLHLLKIAFRLSPHLMLGNSWFPAVGSKPCSDKVVSVWF